jgi:NAD(P)-dependent dehydrogenase (short-subunit alcohol dehydrogenase family)
MGELAGFVALVTGAGRGIGLAIAERFCREGATVTIAEIDRISGLAAAERLRAENYDAECIAVDVTDRAAMGAAVDGLVERHGRLDVLVNNAGLAIVGPSAEASAEDWTRQVDVLLSGVFVGCQAAARAMLPRRSGAIVNVSSIGGLGGWPMRAAYNAAKAGVINLTETLATEWAGEGVRVNSVAPGVTRTEILRQLVEQKVATTAQYEARTPLGRLAEPDEIAAAALFLASPRASGVSGITLRVDGGWAAWSNDV